MHAEFPLPRTVTLASPSPFPLTARVSIKDGALGKLLLYPQSTGAAAHGSYGLFAANTAPFYDACDAQVHLRGFTPPVEARGYELRTRCSLAMLLHHACLPRLLAMQLHLACLLATLPACHAATPC